ISGVTGIRRVDIGNIVQPTDTTPIVTVTLIQPISVVFTLPQNDLPDVQAAMQKGSLHTIAYSQAGRDKLGKGSLLLVNNQISQASGTVELKATFPNQNKRLWPGEFVEVRLITGVQPSAISVPLSALQQGAAGQHVFVVGPGNTVHLQPVKIAETLDGRALVSDGLKPGDTVVTAGQYRLQDGTKIASVAPNDPGVQNQTPATQGMLG
ncbi:MAG TPA: efflux RND transporter periplasmic adaptor subunit, partial [Rhodopila sp.]